MALIIKLLMLRFLSLSMTYDYISPRDRTESFNMYDTLLHSRACDGSLQHKVNRSCLFLLILLNVLLVNEHDLRRTTTKRNTFERDFVNSWCLHSPRLSDLVRNSTREARFSFSRSFLSLETNSL